MSVATRVQDKHEKEMLRIKKLRERLLQFVGDDYGVWGCNTTGDEAETPTEIFEGHYYDVVEFILQGLADRVYPSDHLTVEKVIIHKVEKDFYTKAHELLTQREKLMNQVAGIDKQLKERK